jgi:hypothetical protein
LGTHSTLTARDEMKLASGIDAHENGRGTLTEFSPSAASPIADRPADDQILERETSRAPNGELGIGLTGPLLEPPI